MIGIPCRGTYLGTRLYRIDRTSVGVFLVLAPLGGARARIRNQRRVCLDGVDEPLERARDFLLAEADRVGREPMPLDSGFGEIERATDHALSVGWAGRGAHTAYCTKNIHECQCYRGVRSSSQKRA